MDLNLFRPFYRKPPPQGLVCVADRERARIECFSQANGDSKFILADSPAFGEALYSIAYYPPGLLYGVTGGNEPGARGGFTLDLLSREVVAKWGRGRLDSPHTLALDGKRAVFVGQLTGDHRLLRFAIGATTATTAAVKAQSSSNAAKSATAVAAAHSNGVVNIDVSGAAANTSGRVVVSLVGKSHGVSFWLGFALVCAVISALTLLACLRCRRRRRVGPLSRYGPVLRERKGFELLVNQDDDEDVTFERQANGPTTTANSTATATTATSNGTSPALNSHRRSVPKPVPPLEGEPSTHGEQQA